MAVPVRGLRLGLYHVISYPWRYSIESGQPVQRRSTPALDMASRTRCKRPAYSASSNGGQYLSLAILVSLSGISLTFENKSPRTLLAGAAGAAAPVPPPHAAAAAVPAIAAVVKKFLRVVRFMSSPSVDPVGIS